MTRISFLHGAVDRIQSAAQWLHQAWGRRQAVLVYVPNTDQATRLDRLLWTQPALSFLPHCRADAPLAAQTPIRLTAQLDEPPREACLLNLGDELLPGFSRFELLVEIVSRDDADRLPARDRFKFYRNQGYTIDSYDISGGV